MRTARDMVDLGNHAVLIEDANGVASQHLTAETFVAYYAETNEWRPFNRTDAWWDIRMSQQKDPATIVFPVTIHWEAKQ